nr:protein DEHYDRATION-INDUCED 19 homolog 3-like [Aegilops tauschii subsp. strangulata]
MEELDMDGEKAARPEFAYPYCYEDHEVASLCAHELLNTPSSMFLLLPGSNLSGFLRCILPYAGYLFKKFRLFDLRGYKQRQQAMVKKQKHLRARDVEQDGEGSRTKKSE